MIPESLFQKRLRSLGPDSQSLAQVPLAAKNQPVSGQVVRWTSDVWKKERQKSVLTRTGPNQNSLTGGDWESLMVSMEASHLEIQGGKGRDS